MKSDTDPEIERILCKFLARLAREKNIGRLRIILCLGCLVAPAAMAGGFPGWQSMRVIEQRGGSAVVCPGDLSSQGRDELVVVNTRQSRLDIYRWLPPSERKDPLKINPDRPNDLPLAPEFKRDELPLEHLPHAGVVKDLDGDGRNELIVLLGSPNEVVVYARDELDKWQHQQTYDLLDGELVQGHRSLLLRPLDADRHEVLVSMTDGIVVLALETSARARWLKPREERGRVDWWLADLDGDSDFDLIERTLEAKETIRWYEAAGDGQLLPAEVLHDRTVRGAAMLAWPDQPAQILLVDAAAEGLMRRYRLDVGESNPLGRRRTVALEQTQRSNWCGLRLDGAAVLTVVDPQRPRLITYELMDAGWHLREAYPSISDVKAIAAVASEPGTLLLWAKDAGDLHISRWENGRMSYPKPMAQSHDVEDRKILGLASVGQMTWWVQRVGEHLDLYQWSAGGNGPQRTRFEGAGRLGNKKKVVDKAIWIGDRRLLIKQEHSRDANLATVRDDQTSVTQPAHLKKADPDEFMLLAAGDSLRPARLTDGVLQWLDEQLHSTDQVMLPDGHKLTSYVPRDDGRAWALQEEGEYAHLMESDDSGLAHVVETVKLPGGQVLVHDAELGVMLVGHNRVTHLAEGKPRELNQVDSFDQRVGRPEGEKDAAVHRVTAVDIEGDGKDELILFDDRRHQLTVLGEGADTMEALLSWPVYEDERYPYSGEQTPIVTEPRHVVALDFDGDRIQDLAMLCHDRLIVYLGRDGE